MPGRCDRRPAGTTSSPVPPSGDRVFSTLHGQGCGGREGPRESPGRWPIWLVGDSSPKDWEKHLDEPLDPRHPARHSIWTPVLERIQGQVYRCGRRRVDETRLYMTNAVHDSDDRPDVGSAQWGPELREKAKCFGGRLESYRPALVFTFGAFAFEFLRTGQTGQCRPASHESDNRYHVYTDCP